VELVLEVAVAAGMVRKKVGVLVVDIEAVVQVLVVDIELLGMVAEERKMAVQVLVVDTEVVGMVEEVRMMASVVLAADTADILDRILEQVPEMDLEMDLEAGKDHEVEKLDQSEYLARNRPRCNRLLFDNTFQLNQANKCTKSRDYQEVWSLLHMSHQLDMDYLSMNRAKRNSDLLLGHSIHHLECYTHDISSQSTPNRSSRSCSRQSSHHSNHRSHMNESLVEQPTVFLIYSVLFLFYLGCHL